MANEQILKKINQGTNEAVRPAYTVLIDEPGIQVEGPFYAVTALNDTRFDVSECNIGVQEYDTGTPANGLIPIETDPILPAGMTMYSNMRSIAIVSGSILAYAGPDASPQII